MRTGRPRASQEERTCKKCGVTKSVSCFHKSGSLRGVPQYKTVCKECRKAEVRNYRPLHLKRRYGITEEEYSRMFKGQGGVCKICGRPELKRKHLSVDHCHTTGVVRGLLCNACNVAIGHMQDDPELLIKAAEYLRRFK